MAEIPVDVSFDGRSAGIAAGEPLSPGRELALRGALFLVADPVEISGAGTSYREQRALARQLTPTGRDTRITRFDVLVDDSVSRRRRSQLEDEVRLHLSVRGLPRVVVELSESARLSFVTDMPAGAPLSVPDGVPEKALLRKLPTLARTLEALHATGRAHRALRPEVLIAARDRISLRDAGLAATPVRAGEGPADYRAPEQENPEPVAPGPATDAYQLAAVVYHLLAGRPPGRDPRHSGLSRRVEGALLAALSLDPAQRPTVTELADALAPRT